MTVTPHHMAEPQRCMAPVDAIPLQDFSFVPYQEQLTADDRLEELIQKLKTERDELRVQMHLAKAELRDEWEELEKKWSHAEEHFKDVLDQTRETAEDVQGREHRGGRAERSVSSHPRPPVAAASDRARSSPHAAGPGISRGSDAANRAANEPLGRCSIATACKGAAVSLRYAARAEASLSRAKAQNPMQMAQRGEYLPP